eukprot:3468611-Prymnesium_polylepis.1
MEQLSKLTTLAAALLPLPCSSISATTPPLEAQLFEMVQRSNRTEAATRQLTTPPPLENVSPVLHARLPRARLPEI